jgi:hypothetical protein
MNATLWQATMQQFGSHLVLPKETGMATVNCHCDFFSEKSPSGPINTVYSLGFLMFFYLFPHMR